MFEQPRTAKMFTWADYRTGKLKDGIEKSIKISVDNPS